MAAPQVDSTKPADSIVVAADSTVVVAADPMAECTDTIHRHLQKQKKRGAKIAPLFCAGIRLSHKHRAARENKVAHGFRCIQGFEGRSH